MNCEREEKNARVTDGIKSEEEHGRKTWANKCEYLLSLIGYTTGVGDYWRFPYLAWRNGGGAFVVSFLCAVVVCGIPMYFMELVVSQYSGKNIYGIWNICPLFKGVGISIGIINILFLGYGSVSRYWLVEYIVTSFTGLPWLTCNNTWNTNSCITSDFIVPVNKLFRNGNGTYNETMNTTRDTNNLVTSEEEFWQYKVLDLSEGINDIGEFRWNLCIYALVYRLVIIAVVIKSVRSIGKAMYIFTIIPVLLIAAMWIRTLLLPGAIDGIKYFLVPEFSQLASIRVWIEAVIMAFYTLGTVWGGLIVVGSHSRFDNNCVRASIFGCTADALSAVFSSIVLFSVFGVAAKESGIELEHTVKAGMSAGLVGYTRALSYLPLSQVWTILFFVCVIVATLDVQIVTQEMIISFFQEIFPNKLRKRRIAIIAGSSILVFILNLPFCTQGGPYMVQIIDWYHATLPILIFAVVECITFMWIYGGDKMDKVVKTMMKRNIPHLIRISVSFIMPCVVVVMLIASLMKYKPPTYGSYIYPSYVEVIGWLIALATVFPAPIYIIHLYNKQRGPPSQRFTDMIHPCDIWILKENEKSDDSDTNIYFNRFKFNITGKERLQPTTFEVNVMEDRLS